jgi:hypothetical protein
MMQVVLGSVQTMVLAAISAVLYVCFFQFNTWIFAGFEHSQGVSWVFLPAGFRVILVLLLGLPGALGMVLGSWYIDREMFDGSSQMLAILNGVVSGFTPLVILKYLTKRQWVSEKLQDLTTRQLLNMTLILSAASALTHQLMWLAMDKPYVNPWVDFWPMFFGNLTGALLMLYIFKFLLDRVRVKN